MIDDLVRQVDPILGRQLLVKLDDLRLIADFKTPADYANLSERLSERTDADTAERIAHRNMVEFFATHLPEAQ